MEFSNTTTLDRGVRIGLGLLMLVLGWQSDGTWALLLRVVGLYPLITGLVGWCPVYALVRLRSKRR